MEFMEWLNLVVFHQRDIYNVYNFSFTDITYSHKVVPCMAKKFENM